MAAVTLLMVVMNCIDMVIFVLLPFPLVCGIPLGVRVMNYPHSSQEKGYSILIQASRNEK